MVSRDVSISILGLLYLIYELSYLPVVMETLFSKLHEVLHNPIIAKTMKRNNNVRGRLRFFILSYFICKVTDNKNKNSQTKLRVEDFLLFAVVFCGGSCSMTAHRRCRLALQAHSRMLCIS